MAPGTSTNESELASKAFVSPGAATARMMRTDSSSDPHSFSVGLSPVARDMFDEKNEVMDPMRKRARQKKMSERHGYDTDDTDPNNHRSGLPRHPSSSGSDSSYQEQRVVTAPYPAPAATLAPGMPPSLHHPIVYGAGVHQPHPTAGTPFYYSPHLHHIGPQPPHAIPPPPPHSIPPPPLPIPPQKGMQTVIMPNSRGNDSAMSRRVAEHQHQHQHPHYIHAGQGGLAIPPPPPPPTMVPGAPPGGVAMVPPPPHMASTMYYPPGYYYYPGFMVPPPTDPSAAAVAGSHHPHVYPQPSAIPHSYSAPGMMESSYYNQHDHYDQDDDESVNHHRSTGSA